MSLIQERVVATMAFTTLEKSILPSHQHPVGLYAESHDRINDIVVVLLESLDSLLSGDTGLLHDELNVLGLKTRVIDLLVVILFLLVLLLALNSLALALVVMVVVVIVAGVVVGSLLSLGELLGSGSLGLGVQVLNLGLTEDAGAGSALEMCDLMRGLLTSRCCLKETCRHRAG